MIVIIRDIEVATNNADSLIASGIDAIPLAVLSHMPIELEPNVLNVSYQAIIFTSKYGILNYDSFFNLPAWCVGDITANVAKNIGYTNVISSSGSAFGLANDISNNLDSEKGPLLWVSGADIAFDIKAYLNTKRFNITRAISYQMTSVSRLNKSFIELVKLKKIKGVVILSKRNFHCFRELMIAEGIWEHHQKWQLFTFQQIPFTAEETSSFAGTIKSNTASFEHLFNCIKDWYSTFNESNR